MNRAHVFLGISSLFAGASVVLIFIVATIVCSLPEESFTVPVEARAQQFLSDLGYPENLEVNCNEMEIVTGQMASCIAKPPNEARLEFFCNQQFCILKD